MKKLILVIILLFVMTGCTATEVKPVANTTDDHEQLILDLIERIGELEQEVGNLKEDLEDGIYD